MKSSDTADSLTMTSLKRTSDQSVGDSSSSVCSFPLNITVDMTDDGFTFSVKKAKVSASAEEKPTSDVQENTLGLEQQPSDEKKYSSDAAANGTEVKDVASAVVAGGEKTVSTGESRLVANSMDDVIDFISEHDISKLTNIKFTEKVNTIGKPHLVLKKYAPNLHELTTYSKSMVKSLSEMKLDEFPPIRVLNILSGHINHVIELVKTLSQSRHLVHLEVSSVTGSSTTQRAALCEVISTMKLTSLCVDSSAYQGELLFVGNLSTTLEELFCEACSGAEATWETKDLKSCSKLKLFATSADTHEPLSPSQCEILQSLPSLSVLSLSEECTKEQLSLLTSMESLKELVYRKSRLTPQLVLDLVEVSGRSIIKKITTPTIRESMVVGDRVAKYELTSPDTLKGSKGQLLLSFYVYQ
jgi:hypothetical protein